MMKTLVFLLQVLSVLGENRINWDDVTLNPFLEEFNFQGKGCQKFNIDDSMTKIVGGKDAQPHAYPHQVALLMKRNGQEGYSFCGGVLITENYVLTAAHCIANDKNGVPVQNVEVILGAHKIKEDESSQVRLTSTEFFHHEQYDSQSITNDIGLVKLPQSVTQNQYIKTIPLATNDPPVGQIVTATGWGKRSDQGSGSDILQVVQLPIMNQNDCNQCFDGFIKAGMICLSGTGIKGACNGDSGGPLVYNDELVGLTSFGMWSCEQGAPSVYTRLSYYNNWIQSKIQIQPATPPSSPPSDGGTQCSCSCFYGMCTCTCPGYTVYGYPVTSYSGFTIPYHPRYLGYSSWAQIYK